ncbi:ROK family protein [Aquimarina sp. 2201CG5-10]|uniref:ROK family protein n=1 Tax=Aquimarina callyspongiae TaxID=3098150 RepID=UPI002AB56435|nr:ROK family protein [Aquimarina sp. 2201CG5-10]MDY8138402.1 ROK family protein [Aquimarina sp. 2201CG5-10]
MVLGVDIGGSHISVAIIDENIPYEVRQIYTVKVGHKEKLETIIDSWICGMQLAIDNLGDKELKGIGIAIPGPFDYNQGVFPDKGESKFEALYNLNLKECIVDRLKLKSSVPVQFYNDAACFGIGEAWIGQIASCKKAIAITLGTGFGATFLINGVPVTSGKGVPLYGELYHLPFGDDIADTHFSTQWFQKRYKELTDKEITGVKELMMFTENNPIVVQIFEEFSGNLAVFLEPWLRDFEAEAIVIGGNISNAWTFFESNLSQALNKLNIKTELYKSQLRENAALVGGARLVDVDFYSKLY